MNSQMCAPAWHLAAGLSTDITLMEFLPTKAPNKHGQLTSGGEVFYILPIHRISHLGEFSDVHWCELCLKAHPHTFHW